MIPSQLFNSCATWTWLLVGAVQMGLDSIRMRNDARTGWLGPVRRFETNDPSSIASKDSPGGARLGE